MSKKDAGRDNEIWSAVAAERTRLADELATLTQDQWDTQSQCEAWTVKELAGHLVAPLETSAVKFMFALLKNRMDFDKTIVELAAKFNAVHSADDIVAKLRGHADNRWTPTGFGAAVPLGEIVVHGQDVRRPLGMASTVPAETVQLTLDSIDDDLRADYIERIGQPISNDR